jgi:glycosyltransferase involved in cell wall biosynthesis
VDRNRLAVGILTLNEEKDLPNCLKSVTSLDSDIYVFDSNSIDETQFIAKSFGAEVVPFQWNGRYPKKKQFALNHLRDKYEWVIILDADECLTPQLVSEINDKLRSSPDVVAYDAGLSYTFQHRTLKHGLRFKKTILVKPEFVSFPIVDDLEVSQMWEVEGHYQPALNCGQKATLKNPLLHEDSGPLFDFFSRHNRYSEWECYVRSRTKIQDQIMSNRPLRARLHSKLPFMGFNIFLYSYVVRMGFLDGRPGFDFAMNQAFYYWQVRAKMFSKSKSDELGKYQRN